MNTSSENISNNISMPPGVPTEAAAFLQEVGYFLPDRLKIGDFVPPLVLKRLNAEVSSIDSSRVSNSGREASVIKSVMDTSIVIGTPDALLPTVLIFGSYT